MCIGEIKERVIQMMTVGDIKKMLSQFSDDEPVWVYEQNDLGEPYQPIENIERGPFGDIAIYR